MFENIIYNYTIIFAFNFVWYGSLISLFLCVVHQEVRGGHVLEEDGGGAVILGRAEAQVGSAPSDGPAQHAGAAPTGQ